MKDKTAYTLGTRVTCTDGSCGTLIRTIVDPTAGTLTHLVVGSKNHSPRLVPVNQVATGTPNQIDLTCDLDHFTRLDAAQVTEYLPPALDQGGFAPDQARAYSPRQAKPSSVTYDHVPDGEIEVRGEPLHAADGDIGRVHGLVVDTQDHHLTHVLLTEGHLWTKKDVAIPVEAVAKLSGGVYVDLTKHEVKDLPEVEMDSLV